MKNLLKPVVLDEPNKPQDGVAANSSPTNESSALDARAVGPSLPSEKPAEEPVVVVKKPQPDKNPSKPLKALNFDVPKKISKYTIGEKLGSGTCGIVYKAQDEVLNRIVAVKLSPIGKPDESTGKVPGAQRAFMTEISAAGKLKHPNIVTVYDAGQQGELNFLIMEHVPGYSLKLVGKGQKLLTPTRAIEVIIECCKALDYSHKRNIVHRDIKPANIMLSRDGSVKVLDFGIAVSTSGDDKLSVAGPTLGTPNYMSPEQIRGLPLGPASDFYSLATVLFEMLTGKQLFKAKQVKDLFRIVVGEEAPKLADIRPDLPLELSNVIAKSLLKPPAERYQSGEELTNVLTPILEQMKIMGKRSEKQLSFIKMLRTTGFFSQFSESEIAVFLNFAKQHDCLNGDLIIEHSAQSRDFSVVVSGVVIIRKDADIVGVLGEGDTFGELGFIHNDPSPVQVVAMHDVTVLTIDPDFLNKLSPRVHLHYYKQISESLVGKMSVETAYALDLDLEP